MTKLIDGNTEPAAVLKQLEWWLKDYPKRAAEHGDLCDADWRQLSVFDSAICTNARMRAEQVRLSQALTKANARIAELESHDVAGYLAAHDAALERAENNAADYLARSVNAMEQRDAARAQCAEAIVERDRALTCESHSERMIEKLCADKVGLTMQLEAALGSGIADRLSIPDTRVLAARIDELEWVLSPPDDWECRPSWAIRERIEMLKSTAVAP